MTTTPWRIAAQSVTVLDPGTKEPAFTLQFILDHQQADVCKLRMTPVTPRGPALEMEFTTGGFPIGQPIKQPRWLKAFERPDPNLYLDDAGKAKDHRKGLPEDQQRSWDAKRDGYLKRRNEWESVHGASGSLSEVSNPGPDDTDPNSPEAEKARAAKSGVDNANPSDADRKGMATQPAGGQAGELAKQAQTDEQRAPNAVDQQRQKQGQPVDTEKGTEQKKRA